MSNNDNTNAKEPFCYDDERSASLERSYQTPEIIGQRARAIALLHPQPGETVIDIGCGPGLLTEALAAAVDVSGCVIGVDTSEAMLALAQARCAALPQVRLPRDALTAMEARADAAVCAQVLLYVDDVDVTLNAVRSLLRPDGRLLIVETDWRGLVLNSEDRELSSNVLAAWDAAVPHPDLVGKLPSLLRRAGFADIAVEAYPVLCTDYAPGGFAAEALTSFADMAQRFGRINERQRDAWLAQWQTQSQDGAFFFCVNRMLTVARFSPDGR